MSNLRPLPRAYTPRPVYRLSTGVLDGLCHHVPSGAASYDYRDECGAPAQWVCVSVSRLGEYAWGVCDACRGRLSPAMNAKWYRRRAAPYGPTQPRKRSLHA